MRIAASEGLLHLLTVACDVRKRTRLDDSHLRSVAQCAFDPDHAVRSAVRSVLLLSLEGAPHPRAVELLPVLMKVRVAARF